MCARVDEIDNIRDVRQSKRMDSSLHQETDSRLPAWPRSLLHTGTANWSVADIFQWHFVMILSRKLLLN